MPVPSAAPALALTLRHALGPDLPQPAAPTWPPAWPPAGSSAWLAATPPGTWLAVLLVSLSTLAGAWLARRNIGRIGLWLAVASALMLITALVELLPDAWHEAGDTGTPLWLLGLSAVFGFAVITYFTRKGCGHAHDQPRRGQHAPGLHRRVTRAVGAALFGGVGTAAALTVHRLVEGATLALAASVVVVAALMIHSASEGLALTALLDLARRRLTPWLAASCLSPAVGVVLAVLAPLPPSLVPLLLGMITGVLLRTAVVGLKLARTAGGGRLSARHMAITGAAVLVTTTLLVAAQYALDDSRTPLGLGTTSNAISGHTTTPHQTTGQATTDQTTTGREAEQAATSAESTGQETTGQETTDQTTAGQETTGQETMGQSPGQESTGQATGEQGTTSQATGEQGTTGLAGKHGADGHATVPGEATGQQAAVQTATPGATAEQPTPGQASTPRKTTGHATTGRAGGRTGGTLLTPQALPAPSAGPAPALSRAQLRQGLADGRLDLAGLLRRTDATTAATPVGWLLRAVPEWRDRPVGRLLSRGGIAADATVGELTTRQRRYLLRALAQS
ncbi:hypothetical protein [Nonomuraea sp. NPDC003804]|uniref:hypothetical protein n=1 Tax=Nonomuraea sp. NPDC003804 TaxID=3154547 RepID=UPI0033A173C3